MQTRNLIRLSVVPALVMGLAAVAIAGDKDAGSSAHVGEKAPDFQLRDTAGKTHRLSDLSGKIVVLEWTNHKCPYVQAHHKNKTTAKLAEKYKGRDVVWLAIDSSHYADAKVNAEHARTMGINYPILHDADGKVGKAFGARTTPHMFVIDRQGTLAYAGAIDNAPMGKTADTPRNYVTEALDALVDGSQVAISTTKPYGCSVKYARR